jgi:TctA family transporter
MIINEWFLILLAVPIGLLIGMMPGVALSVATLISLPVLLNFDVNFIISFFVCVGVASQFSNSVIAIYAGIPGDFTALPIVQERKNLLSSYSINQNLFRTASASIIGSLSGLLFIILFFKLLAPYSTWIMRTEFIFIIVSVIVIGSILWPKNKISTNIILIIIGSLIGSVGYYSTLNVNILTFNNTYLFNGIPILAGFLAVYALPNIIDLQKDLDNLKLNENLIFKKYTIVSNFSYKSAIIGSVVGCFCGLIPLISAWASSNTAYTISKKINKESINHAITSESANSAAYISLIAPLLVFGLAIIPAEIILLEILEFNGWSVKNVTFDTFFILGVSVIVTCVLSYFCTTVIAKKVVYMFIRYQKMLVFLMIGLLLISIYMASKYTYQVEIYFFTFFAFSALGFYFKRNNIQPLPFIFSWGIIDIIIHAGFRITQLHF